MPKKPAVGDIVPDVPPKKEKDPINIFYMIKKIYPMCFKTKPISYLVFSRSMAMLLFALIAANIMVTQIFFDAVYKASIGENSVWGAISALLFFILFRLLNDIVNAMNYFTGQVQIERMIGSVNCGINKKSSQIDPVEYENHIGHGDRETFPSGLDTMLSREFDGVDLSGGQWQRVALARGFYRDSDLIVLDEPTAAIDPIEESAIYKKFVEIAEDKTAIIVTHRMGSAKIARRIVVMREGKIAEIGSHDQLLLLGGLYAHMYSAQAGWYNGV